MSSPQMCHVDLEQGSSRHHHHHHHRSVSGGSEMSMCFSDAENGSCYSHFYSTNGDPYDDYTFGCVSDDTAEVSSRKGSPVSDCSVEVEIESGVVGPEIKVHLAKVEMDCRICHLGLDCDDSLECGVPIELGCACKNDLAAAHKNCAEAWFKIKGNSTCEICQCVARNVCPANEETTQTSLSDSNNGNGASSTISTAASPSEPRRSLQGHRFLNLLLACIVFAFVISWLFHFNMQSSSS